MFFKIAYILELLGLPSSIGMDWSGWYISDHFSVTTFFFQQGKNFSFILLNYKLMRGEEWIW